MNLSHSILGELEDALKSGVPEKRVTTLRRVTELFLNDADRLNEQQIGVFDDVLVHLIQRIENKALVQLSSSLAPLANAPIEVVRHLARDTEITVAGPVLTNSSRLTESDLLEIAASNSQGHLLAISGRSALSEALTDVLVERGDRHVSHRLAKNTGAHFSEFRFCRAGEKIAYRRKPCRTTRSTPRHSIAIASATAVARDRYRPGKIAGSGAA